MPSLYDPGPMTVGDLETAFRVNTDNAVIALVNDCAADLRLEWLEVAMDLGVFDFTDEVAARGTVERSSACIEALAQIFYHTETVLLTDDPELGPLAKTVMTHTLSANAKTLGPFVETLTARLLKDREGIVSTYTFDYEGEKPSNVSGSKLLDNTTRSLAVLQALAAALDLPETVRAVRWAIPAAHLEGLPSKWLGKAFTDELIDATKRMDLAPAFFAIFYSNTEALKAFAPTPAKSSKSNSSDPSAAPKFVPMLVERNADNTLLRHGATALLNTWYPHCAPSTLALSMRKGLDPSQNVSDDDKTALNALACKALYRKPNAYNFFTPQIPAFEAIGAFGFRPDRTICEALENGHPRYVESLKGQVPWDDKDFVKALESVFVKTIENAKRNNSKDESEAAMVALMRHAVEDGRQDVFFRTTTVTNGAMADFTGESLLQPVCDLIQAQFSKVLVGFFDHGLDPLKPMAKKSFTPLAYAEAVGAKDVAHAMVSHTARGRAHSLLDEIDASPFVAPKAKP